MLHERLVAAAGVAIIVALATVLALVLSGSAPGGSGDSGDSGGSGTTVPNTSMPDTSKPDTSKPDTSKPDTSMPDGTAATTTGAEGPSAVERSNSARLVGMYIWSILTGIGASSLVFAAESDVGWVTTLTSVVIRPSARGYALVALMSNLAVFLYFVFGLANEAETWGNLTAVVVSFLLALMFRLVDASKTRKRVEEEEKANWKLQTPVEDFVNYFRSISSIETTKKAKETLLVSLGIYERKLEFMDRIARLQPWKGHDEDLSRELAFVKNAIHSVEDMKPLQEWTIDTVQPLFSAQAESKEQVELMDRAFGHLMAVHRVYVSRPHALNVVWKL